MNKIKLKKVMELIKELEDKHFTDIFVYDYVDEEEILKIDNVEDLIAYIENLDQDNLITNEDIIYYDNAIKYLSDNDNSLTKSIGLAYELGYNLKDLNSEILASLLATQYNKDEFRNFIEDFKQRIYGDDIL